MPNTLYDKLWDEHHITTYNSGESLLYIDRQYLHEVTSPQAFEGLTKKVTNATESFLDENPLAMKAAAALVTAAKLKKKGKKKSKAKA